jgi:phosphoglycerate dehydrogenase-like enzyme
MIIGQSIERMKKGVYLINTARGDRQRADLGGLGGKIAGAALDVLSVEVL